MGSATFVEDFRKGLEFVPVKGKPNLFFIQIGEPRSGARTEAMTAKDWNEFERHVTEAFEQVP
jgi:hypothetical protein